MQHPGACNQSGIIHFSSAESALNSCAFVRQEAKEKKYQDLALLLSLLRCLCSHLTFFLSPAVSGSLQRRFCIGNCLHLSVVRLYKDDEGLAKITIVISGQHW